jgi:hypothetical protein
VGLDPDLEAVVAVVPGWRGHEPTITPIEAGRTNRNFRVEVGSEAFFLRLSDKDTSLLGIDRVAEHEAALAAAAAGGRARGDRPSARDADDPVFAHELLDATVTFRRKRLLHAWTNLPSRFG